MRKSFLLATSAAAAWCAAASAQTPAAPSERPSADDKNAISSVIVVGERAGARTSIDSRSYDVTKDLSAAAGSVADALRNVPSVEVDLQGNPRLRGDPNVTILIDGGPAGQLQGGGRGEALQSMPADQLQRIEVMTNPSAAHGADGSGGVINLVTKRTPKPGRSVTTRATLGDGGRNSVSLSGALGVRSLKLSGDAGWRRVRSRSQSEEQRGLGSGVDEISSHQDGSLTAKGLTTNWRGSAEYSPARDVTLTSEARRFEYEVKGSGIQTDRTSAPRRAPTETMRQLDNGFDRVASMISAGFQQKRAGEAELTGDASFGRLDVERRATVAQVSPPSGAFETSRNQWRQDLTRMKLAYADPSLGPSKLRLGYEYDEQENRFRLSAPAAGGGASLEEYRYKQVVNGSYVTYERPLGPVSVQAGLRLEHTSIAASDGAMMAPWRLDYLDLFPSAHLAHKIDTTRQVVASYSRRIQRPRADDLNPFAIVLDPRNTRSGNPDLSPAKVDTFELGYVRRQGAASVSATIFNKRTRNDINDVLRLTSDGILLSTRENIPRRTSTGAEFALSRRLTPEFNVNLGGSMARERLRLGEVAARKVTAVTGQASLDWQPSPDDFFQLTGSVSGRRVLAQGYRRPSALLNLGYRRKLSEQASLLATAQDLLGSAREGMVIETSQFATRSSRSQNSRAFLVTLVYAFGGGKAAKEPTLEYGAGADPVN